MSEAPKPIDAALDLFVFAPVGLALTAAEELPKLAAKGRTRVNNQLAVARVVGQFAVARGRKMVERRLSQPPSAPAGPSRSTPAPEPVRDDRSYDQLTANEPADLAVVTPIGAARSAPRADTGEGLPGADTVDAGEDVVVSTVGDPAPAPGPQPESGSEPGSESVSGGAGSPARPDPATLAIPGYDSLSASQVVQRLAGLDSDELAAVGAYEQAHRGRRTVLNRVDQLQGR